VVFSRLTSFVLGKAREESPAAGAAASAPDLGEPEYEMDPRETHPLPTVDLHALDDEIEHRLERIRRSQKKR
jgi:hypothetical protein